MHCNLCCDCCYQQVQGLDQIKNVAEIGSRLPPGAKPELDEPLLVSTCPLLLLKMVARRTLKNATFLNSDSLAKLRSRSSGAPQLLLRVLGAAIKGTYT